MSTREIIPLRDKLLNVLAAAQEERGQRPYFAPGKTSPAWHDHELDTMLRATNDLRKAHGRSPIDRSLLERVEGCASGHIDYSTKFALYCAELVLGISPQENR